METVKLVKGLVERALRLILDDYGHYQGARRGVDEYLSKLNKKPLLQRVDYSCRLAIKPTA